MHRIPSASSGKRPGGAGVTSQNIRWAHTPGSRARGFPRRVPLPALGAWLGILVVVLLIIGAVWLVIWLPSLFFA